MDAKANRQAIFKAGLIPHTKEHPRNRQATQRGRTRLCNAALQARRLRVERTCAWEDKGKRRWLRFARIQPRHSGMKLLGDTLINGCAFRGV